MGEQSQINNLKPVVKPPLLFASALAISILLHLAVPLRFFSATKSGFINGLVFTAAGAILLFWAMRTLKTAGVNPRFKPVSTIVIAGPFAFSRNPIYLSFILIYAGIAFLMSTAWPFVFLPFVLVILHYGVIRREEQYLEKQFGEEYRRYCAKVRRWL